MLEKTLLFHFFSIDDTVTAVSALMCGTDNDSLNIILEKLLSQRINLHMKNMSNILSLLIFFHTFSITIPERNDYHEELFGSGEFRAAFKVSLLLILGIRVKQLPFHSRETKLLRNTCHLPLKT